MADTQSAAQRKPPDRVKASSSSMLRFAGKKWFPLWAQVKHRGRRSGKEYVIPVAVLVKPDRFVISLPWGATTNWVQNVMAANGCTIVWKGADHRVTEPRLVDKAVALEAANAVQRMLLSRAKFPAFLQLKR